MSYKHHDGLDDERALARRLLREAQGSAPTLARTQARLVLGRHPAIPARWEDAQLKHALDTVATMKGFPTWNARLAAHRGTPAAPPTTSGDRGA